MRGGGGTNTVPGTDLIVGARGSPIQVLLYSVSHLDNATSNLSWQSYQAVAVLPQVAWSVPLSLGDFHRGFRVLGTTRDYCERYRYGKRRALAPALPPGAPQGDLPIPSVTLKGPLGNDATIRANNGE
ncbi:MAG: hypothetical protein ACRERE_45625 [Candidatus Entotheonellia bacterium]